MVKFDKEMQDKIDKMADLIFFKKNGLGWMAVIGILAPPIMMLARELDRIAWDRVAWSMLYFGFGILLTRIAVPPLKEGLRPLEYLLGAFGWPLVVVCMFIVVALLCYEDIVAQKKELKGPKLLALCLIMQLFGNAPTLQEKILERSGLADALEEIDMDEWK